MSDWIEEEWRPIPDFPVYDASNFGRIRSRWSGRAKELKQSLTKLRRPSINLSRNGKPHSFETHTLIARTFLGPRPPGHEVNHIDGEKLHNFAWNLEYLTPEENRLHAQRLRLYSKNGNAPRGERHGRAKLTWLQVTEMRRVYAAGHISQRSLAVLFGIGLNHVKKILQHRIWKSPN